MRKGKNGIRRIAALACSVALLATMLPAQVLAADEATSEPLAAVTSLEESGEEKAPEQGETGIQPETENACTKSEDCAAEIHAEGCPKYVAPAEEEDTDPVVSCTKSEDCQADTHEEGCPKYVAPAEEEDTDPVVSCTKSEDCVAETHEEGCPKYVAPAEEGTASSSADNAKSEGTPVDPQEEKTQYAVMVEEKGGQQTPQNLYVDNVALIEQGTLTGHTVEGVTYSRETNTLNLNGANITDGYVYDDGKDTAIYADGDLTIELSDENTIVGSMRRGVNVTGALTIEGAGSLTSQSGIYAATIDIQSTGNIDITASSECLYSISGDITIQSGVINLDTTNGSWSQVVYSAGGFTVGGGNITITAPTDTDATYTYGVYTNSGNILIQDGSISSTAKQDSLYAKGDIVIEKGTVNAPDGIRAQGGGSVYVTGGNVNVGGKGIETVAELYLLSGNIQFSGQKLFANHTIFIDNAQIELLDNLSELKLQATTYVLNTVEDFKYKLYCTDISSSLGYNSKAIAYVSDPANQANVSYFVGTEDNKKYAKGHFAYAEGGFFDDESTFDFEKKTLVSPKKDGALFSGWYENKEYTGEPAETYTAGKTYYAKWTGMDDMELQYGAEQTIVSNGVTLSGYESDNPSVATVDTNGNVKAVGVGTATISATGTYDNEPTAFTMTVTVTPRPINYTLTGDDTGSGSITYNYSDEHHALSDSMTFKWADEPETVVPLTEGTDINYTYTVEDPEAPDGGKPLTYDYLPMPVGEYTVSFNLKNPNYTFKLSDGTTSNTLAVEVNVTAEGTQRAYLASAAPTANQNFSYTGEGVLPVEGILNAYAENSVSSSTVEIGTFTVNIEGLNGTSFHSEVSEIEAGTNLSAISGLALPTDPGTYIITASAVNDKYYLYKSLVFTINKATVTITAADKTVIAGDEDGLPSLSNPTEGKDYTVTGLAAGHSLTTAPTLNYSEEANVDAVATYSIIPSGAAADEKYYTLQYVNGTLHVEKIAIIEGANQTWTKESGKDLVIRSNADFSDFLGVTVNDVELVQNQDYTAKSGSTIVTIKADYLNSLAAGDYKIAIVSDTGSAVTKFTVKAETAGDSDTSNNDNTAGGNTGSTTTQSGSGIVYYTCPACGYHDWTAGADGYKCNHCGYVESVKQLSGYGNVKGVYEPKTSAAAAQSASATSSSAIPQTSDAMPVGLLGGVTVVAAAAFAALFVLRKRKHND